MTESVIKRVPQYFAQMFSNRRLTVSSLPREGCCGCGAIMEAFCIIVSEFGGI